MSDFLHELGHRALGAPSRLRPNTPARLMHVPEAPLETDAFASPMSSEPAASPKPSLAHEPSSATIERGASGSLSALDRRVGPMNRRLTDKPGGGKVSADADGSAADQHASGNQRHVTSAAALHTAVDERRFNRAVAVPDRGRSKGPPLLESVRGAIDAIIPADSGASARTTRQPPQPVATAGPRLSQPDIAASRVEAIAPEVNIHIGRIELTAVLAQPPARREPPPIPKTSLDEYLRRRSGRPS